mmetsp:Transcript_5819/g.19763  ORF Transcript_5819/g.19763 Transcript_5819/m.19763 type:complete len:268 (-) Transcript_5819:361-1164(-)
MHEVRERFGPRDGEAVRKGRNDLPEPDEDGNIPPRAGACHQEGAQRSPLKPLQPRARSRLLLRVPRAPPEKCQGSENCRQAPYRGEGEGEVVGGGRARALCAVGGLQGPALHARRAKIPLVSVAAAPPLVRDHPVVGLCEAERLRGRGARVECRVRGGTAPVALQGAHARGPPQATAPAGAVRARLIPGPRILPRGAWGAHLARYHPPILAGPAGGLLDPKVPNRPVLSRHRGQAAFNAEAETWGAVHLRPPGALCSATGASLAVRL